MAALFVRLSEVMASPSKRSAALAPANLRLPRLDALRGMAMVWMTVFHFCFDLTYFGYWRQNFYDDPVWTWQRNAIVSLFLFTAGLGQAMAVAQGQSWQRFGRRWLQVLACASLVSLGSWFIFPHSFIYFGVLHGLALMLLITRWLLVRSVRSTYLLLMAVLALGAAWWARTSLADAVGPTLLQALNSRPLNWLGLISQKPITEDYVPLLPWLALVLLGAVAGRWLLAQRPTWLEAKQSWLGRGLATLGRWSLSYYMLHQLVLMGLLTALAWLRGAA